MNTKLKFALIRRYSDRGFAMPIAIGMGLIMILIAATLMMRSQGDQTTASAQKETARSLGTAETGITRVQSLLNKYGILANIALSNIDTTTPPSSTWKQVYDASPSAAAGCTAGAAGATELSGYRLNQWINLNSGGQFRVTEYTYKPNSAQITAIATIPVVGSVSLNISPTDYLADGSSVYGQIQSAQGSLSRIGNIYTFRPLSISTAITINSTDTFVPKNTPAQFTSSATIPANGSVDVTSNISPSNYLANGGSVEGQIQGIRGTLSRSGANYTFKRQFSGTATTTTANFLPTTTPGTGTLTVEGRVNQAGSGITATETASTATTRLQVNIPVQEGTYPNIPFPGMWVSTSVNTGDTAANILAPCSGTANANLDSGYTLRRTNATIPNPPSKPTTNIKTIAPAGKTLPENPTTDLTNFNSATGEYQYSVSQINDSFSFRPGYKVAIYLDGDIDLQGGQKAIVHQCGIIPNCSPTDARIYGLSSSGTLNLGGNSSICDILFLAPTYAVTLNGGGQAQGCGGGANNNGVYWVKSWSGGGQGNHTSLDQTNASWDDVSFLIPKPPKIAPTTSWQRQETP